MNPHSKNRPQHRRADPTGAPRPHPDCLKVISYLLQYPAGEFLAKLPSLRPVLEDWPDDGVRRDLVRFSQWLMQSDPLQIQETYTAAFELNPSTSMNLTYHLWGDDEKRGRVLAQLQQIYQQEGYECDCRELPDHLPLLLEFYSQQPQWIGDALSRRILTTLKPLAARLEEAGSAYAGIFELLVRQLVPEGKAAPEPDAETRTDPTEIRP